MSRNLQNPGASLPAIDATVALFQAYPASGTFGTAPNFVNDNNVATSANASIIGQYAHVNFGRLVTIGQWRQSGLLQAYDGEWKLQYWRLTTQTWVDWVTGIVTRGTGWSVLAAAATVVTTAIRLVCVAVDTMYGYSRMGELEVVK